MAYKVAGRRNEVNVQIWRPEPIDLDDPGHSDYRCAFDIVGLPEEMHHSGQGVDSMQALVSALAGVNQSLKPYRDSLSWLDMPYDEIALVVQVADAGRRRRIDEILNEEEYAIERRLSRNANRQGNAPQQDSDS